MADIGTWYVLQSSSSPPFTKAFSVRFGGQDSGAGLGAYFNEVPVPSDYDADGKADIAIFKVGCCTAANNVDAGTWYILQGGSVPSFSAAFSVKWGRGREPVAGNYEDRPVPGDYDGDGRIDIAVWKQTPTSTPDGGTWYVLQQGPGPRFTKAFSVVWGTGRLLLSPSDLPIAALIPPAGNPNFSPRIY